jgi:hypothetical protein
MLPPVPPTPLLLTMRPKLMLFTGTSYTSDTSKYSLHLCFPRYSLHLCYSQCALNLCYSQALPTPLPLPRYSLHLCSLRYSLTLCLTYATPLVFLLLKGTAVILAPAGTQYVFCSLVAAPYATGKLKYSRNPSTSAAHRSVYL